MIHWQDSRVRQSVKMATEPFESYVNNYVDAWAWWMLHLWFLPFKVPSIHSDADKFVSQFTLNGIKASNLCKAFTSQ